MDKDSEVIICGGGPVGLSTAYLLGRQGIRTTLFERRDTTTTLPKGQYLHASTGEYFRQWGVWDLLEDAGWTTERSNGQGFYVTVASGLVASIRATEGAHADYERKWSALSPVYPRKVPASDYEAALRQQALAWPSVRLMFSTPVTNVEQTAEGVQVTVHEPDGLGLRTLGARYLIACDGSHSLVRSLLGQGQDQGPMFGNQVLAEFKADLEETLGRDGFFHSFILHPEYAGWFGSQHPDSGLWRYSFRHDEDDPPPPAVVLHRIRGALGMPDLPIELARLHRFDYSTGLLRRWKEGRVLFAGDAAHWHSPWGGFGMNSGVHDANNLAWKLGLVLRGKAADTLLETYEEERMARGRTTVKTATYNSLHYLAIVESMRIGEAQALAQGRVSEEAALFLRQRLESHGGNSVLHTGYQLGTVYRSAAICPDPPHQPPTPELADFEESTVPGVRAPHAWLIAPDGKRISTLDLWGPHFTLVLGGAESEWARACELAEHEFKIRLKCYGFADAQEWQPADGKFASLYAQREGQATLIRPDGYVAARLCDRTSPNKVEGLFGVLRSVLGV
jgi:2-polyprenyl-6-methoxyphenol hydroxylase-like FAD-dependent oxidoreductase